MLPNREQLGSVRWFQQRLHGSGTSPPRATSEYPPATLKRVPPTPNNTPVSTPAASPTKSLAIITKATQKNTKKMAKQKKMDGEKRHLVRWNPDLDMKLLLTIQYQCNVAGIVIPWDDIAGIMGPGITGSAVIQHLAKTRSRMVTKGLPVPPPLRRGGAGSRFSTTATVSGVTTAPSTGPTTNATASKNANVKASKTSTKSKKTGKKVSQDSDDSDDDDDDWKDDDSDAGYGEPRAKRAKTIAKGPMKRKLKTEDSDVEVDIPIKAPNPKNKDLKSSSAELSAYGYTDINGVPIDDDTYSEGETKAVVGTGGSWLDLEDELPTKKSLVVSLPSTPIKGDLQPETYEIEEEMFGGDVDMYHDNQSFNPNPIQHSQQGAFGNNGDYNSNIGQVAPPAIQTSWPQSYGSMGSSSVYTSVNQTPAGTSAGPDHSIDYFDNSQYDFGQFDDGAFDFSVNDATDSLFNADSVDGNFCGGYFGGNHYGN